MAYLMKEEETLHEIRENETVEEKENEDYRDNDNLSSVKQGVISKSFNKEALGAI